MSFLHSWCLFSQKGMNPGVFSFSSIFKPLNPAISTLPPGLTWLLLGIQSCNTSISCVFMYQWRPLRALVCIRGHLGAFLNTCYPVATCFKFFKTFVLYIKDFLHLPAASLESQRRTELSDEEVTRRRKL